EPGAHLLRAWLELTQWLDVRSNGGDARNVTVEPIGKRNAINMPAGFNATSITLIFGHDIAAASQQALIAASRGLQKRAFKMVIEGG
ncbi:phage tail protein, partial [Erwinia amylovora]|uniref:phage tail protein n=1 Tax=Erwinia amylovora TaxID=552 RepID=UPI0020C07CE1